MDPMTMAMLFGTGMSLFGGEKEIDPWDRGKRILFKQMQPLIDYSYQRQGELIRDKGKKAVAGFERARGEADVLGQTRRTDVLQREQAASGGIQDAMAGSGMSGSTVGGNLQRGLASDTNRELAAVDSALAGIYADLDIGIGQAEAGTLGEQANLEQQHMNAIQNLYKAKFGIRTGAEFGGVPSMGQASSYDFGGLASLFGDAMGGIDWGSLFGGGGGQFSQGSSIGPVWEG